MANHAKHYKLAILGLLFVAAIWGSGFIAVQVAIDEGASSALIMFVRFTAASLMLGIFARKDFRLATKPMLFAGGAVGLVLFGGFMLQTLGLELSSSPSSNAFLTASNVILVPFFGWFIFKRKPAITMFVAALFCLFGVGILSMQPGQAFAFAAGDLVTLGGAVFFALHTVLLGIYANRLPTKLLTFLQVAVTAVLSAIAYFATGGRLPLSLSFTGYAAIFYLAAACTSVAYFLQSLCQKVLNPNTASLIIAAESLFATLFSVALGFETFTLRIALGGFLVAVSLLLAEAKLPVLQKRSTP